MEKSGMQSCSNLDIIYTFPNLHNCVFYFLSLLIITLPSHKQQLGLKMDVADLAISRLQSIQHLYVTILCHEKWWPLA